MISVVNCGWRRSRKEMESNREGERDEQRPVHFYDKSGTILDFSLIFHVFLF